jgi:hypothetical protein
MADFFPPVIFDIRAKATEAIATFGAVNGELDKMEEKGLLAGRSLGSLQSASKYAGAALMGLAGVFGVFAVASVKETLSVEDAQTKLEVAIQNTGVSFKTAKPYVDQQVAAMNALGFSTQDVYGALSTMTAATQSPSLALQELGVAADLARFKGISLAQAGDILARASMGQARGLADLGLAINKTIPKNASFAQIMALVEERTKGTAYAFSKTTTGALQVAQVQFKNLETQLGTALLPILNKVLAWFNTKGIKDIKAFFSFLQTHTSLLKLIVGTLATIWAVGKVVAFIDMLKKVADAWKAIRTAALGAGAAETAANAEGAVGGAASGTAAVEGTIVSALGAAAVISAIGAVITALIAQGIFDLFNKKTDYSTTTSKGYTPQQFKPQPGDKFHFTTGSTGTTSSTVQAQTPTVTNPYTNPNTQKVTPPTAYPPSLKGKGITLIPPKSSTTSTTKKSSVGKEKTGTMTTSTTHNIKVTVTTDHSSTVKGINGTSGNTKTIKLP